MRKLASVISLLLALSGCAGGSAPIRYVDVYFVSETPQGLKLYSEKRGVTSADSNLANAVARDLISGDLQPLDPDYQNLWGASSALNRLTVSSELVTVDFNVVMLNLGAEGEARAIDQLVWTLTGILGVEQVAFLVNGEKVESFAGHVDTTGIFQRGPDYAVLSNVQISSFVEATTLATPVLIEGEACVFEASLVWELYRNTELLLSGNTMAEEACPARSKWQLDLGELASGDYEIVIWEESVQDGSVNAIDTKNFVVP